MTPLLFPIVSADPAVTALIGANPVRFYPFDRAPQPGTSFYALPYCTWQQISGTPQNSLSCRPDTDMFSVQVDIWAETGSGADDIMTALAGAIETRAHITRLGVAARDSETGLYRLTFDVDLWQQRA